MLKDDERQDEELQRTLGMARTALPLPERLRVRLRAIPEEEVRCTDVERLYRSARRAAHGQGLEAAVEAHLAHCRRCRRLYGALAVALRPASLPMPGPLVFRLARLARQVRRPVLPLWIRDVRIAAVACYLMTAGLMAVAGDPTAFFREATTAAGVRASRWAVRGEAEGRALLSSLSTETRRGLAYSRARAAAYGQAWEAWLARATPDLAPEEIQQTINRLFKREGDDDGTADDKE